MHIGVLGINHKLADLRLRELLAKACQRRFGAGASTHGTHHVVLLSTCNRTEIYFSSEDLAVTHTYLLHILRNEVNEEFDQKLYSYFGQDCFHHLARVTAGLDSAIVAETEIQGQVKNAYELSGQFSQLSEEIHYLFQKSLKTGKKIRSTYLQNRDLPEIEHAIFQTGRLFFKDKETPKVLFIGVSDINQKILQFLKSKNLTDITICNRTEARALTLANAHNLQVLKWRDLSDWTSYDWIIFGTKSPNYLISHNDLPSLKDCSKLIIDLSVPRNVDPNIATIPNITLVNIDKLNKMLTFRKQKLYHLLNEAELYIIHTVKQQVALFKQKQNNRERLFAHERVS